jgi:alpha/beta superfamily hydrolase
MTAASAKSAMPRPRWTGCRRSIPNIGGLWIAGYSFGAFIGMQLLMRRPEISGWVSVAPPANHYDFGFLAPCPCGGLMLHGDTDELVPEPAVRKLVDKLNTQKNVHVDYRVFAGADHVFAEHADAVSEAVEDLRQGDRSPPDGARRRLNAVDIVIALVSRSRRVGQPEFAPQLSHVR